MTLCATRCLEIYVRLRENGTTIVIRIKGRMGDRGVGITIVTFACATIVWFVPLMGGQNCAFYRGQRLRFLFAYNLLL